MMRKYIKSPDGIDRLKCICMYLIDQRNDYISEYHKEIFLDKYKEQDWGEYLLDSDGKVCKNMITYVTSDQGVRFYVDKSDEIEYVSFSDRDFLEKVMFLEVLSKEDVDNNLDALRMFMSIKVSNRYWDMFKNGYQDIS